MSNQQENEWNCNRTSCHFPWKAVKYHDTTYSNDMFLNHELSWTFAKFHEFPSNPFILTHELYVKNHETLVKVRKNRSELMSRFFANDCEILSYIKFKPLGWVHLFQYVISISIPDYRKLYFTQPHDNLFHSF